ASPEALAAAGAAIEQILALGGRLLAEIALHRCVIHNAWESTREVACSRLQMCFVPHEETSAGEGLLKLEEEPPPPTKDIWGRKQIEVVRPRSEAPSVSSPRRGRRSSIVQGGRRSSVVMPDRNQQRRASWLAIRSRVMPLGDDLDVDLEDPDESARQLWSQRAAQRTSFVQRVHEAEVEAKSKEASLRFKELQVLSKENAEFCTESVAASTVKVCQSEDMARGTRAWSNFPRLEESQNSIPESESMETLCAGCLAGLFTGALGAAAYRDRSGYVLPAVGRTKRHSLLVKGHVGLPPLALDILVAAPPKRAPGPEEEPLVFYVLDPQPLLFGAAALFAFGQASYFANSEACPEAAFRRMYVVGVGHASEDFCLSDTGFDAQALRQLRRRDFPPRNHASILPGRGPNAHARRLVEALVDEVLPHVEKNLLGLSQTPRRCLLGASYSAVVALQTMLLRPGAFTSLVLGSPSVSFDPEILEDVAAGAYVSTALQADVMVQILLGEWEGKGLELPGNVSDDLPEGVHRLAAALRERGLSVDGVHNVLEEALVHSPTLPKMNDSMQFDIRSVKDSSSSAATIAESVDGSPEAKPGVRLKIAQEGRREAAPVSPPESFIHGFEKTEGCQPSPLQTMCMQPGVVLECDGRKKYGPRPRRDRMVCQPGSPVETAGRAVVVTVLVAIGGLIRKARGCGDDEYYEFRDAPTEEDKLLLDEEWRTARYIGGLDSSIANLMVSSHGRISHLLCGREVISYGARHPSGYYSVNKSGRFMLVHRLVAATFLGQPRYSHLQVNHKDLDRGNNHVTNLEYVTGSENVRHADAVSRSMGLEPNGATRKRVQARLKTGGVFWQDFDSIKAAALQTGFSPKEVSRLCRQPSEASSWEFQLFVPESLPGEAWKDYNGEAGRDIGVRADDRYVEFRQISIFNASRRPPRCVFNVSICFHAEGQVMFDVYWDMGDLYDQTAGTEVVTSTESPTAKELAAMVARPSTTNLEASQPCSNDSAKARPASALQAELRARLGRFEGLKRPASANLLGVRGESLFSTSKSAAAVVTAAVCWLGQGTRSGVPADSKVQGLKAPAALQQSSKQLADAPRPQRITRSASCSTGIAQVSVLRSQPRKPRQKVVLIGGRGLVVQPPLGATMGRAAQRGPQGLL
ncbi:unnamed protein product, partial [Symbiodinium sp. KB8]